MHAAALSIDLDDLWTYRRSFGFDDWADYPSFLPAAVPRFLKLIEELGCRATAFVVGHDASLGRNRQILKSLAASDIEIGNHSYWHRPALQRQNAASINSELAETERAILSATSRRTVGFRGPAFSTSPTLLACLLARGYRYDASAFPTSIGPLARAYQRLSAQRATPAQPDGEKLYGSFRAAAGSLQPFYWCQDKQRLLEIPVTTMPYTRLPFHMTYIQFLADRSPALARRYFDTALCLCQRSRIAPSLLLHATDFVGQDDPFPLSCIPGMQRRATEKIALVKDLLQRCQRAFPLTSLSDFADLAEHPDYRALALRAVPTGEPGGVI